MNKLAKKITFEELQQTGELMEIVSGKHETAKEVIRAGEINLKNFIEQNDRSTARKIVYSIIANIVESSDLLQFSTLEIKMLAKSVTMDYDVKNKVGGFLNFTFDDIRICLEMGMLGSFGKPAGHKYVLPELTGQDGWFEKYHDYKNTQFEELLEEKRKRLELRSNERKKSNGISMPDEVRNALRELENRLKNKYHVMNQSAKEYKSIKEFCEVNGINEDEYVNKRVQEFVISYNNLPKEILKKVPVDDYIGYKMKEHLQEMNKGIHRTK